MKRALACLLVLALLNCTTTSGEPVPPKFPAEVTSTSGIPAPKSVALVEFFLGATIAGMVITFWICKKYTGDVTVSATLQRSTDGRATWVDIYGPTNITLHGTAPTHLFDSLMTDPDAFYRVKIVR